MHSGIGKVSFDKDKIKENLITFVERINRLKPASAKGKYIKNATISLTMSPSIKLNTTELMDLK